MTSFLAGVLAQTPPGAERGEEFGKTSPIALVVILLLLVATVLLIRSMGKHLRKVPESFEETDGTGGDAGDAGDRAPEDAAGTDAPTPAEEGPVEGRHSP